MRTVNARGGEQSVLFAVGAAAGEGPFAGVVFNRPVDQVFSYKVPARLRDRLAPGARVQVPLGRGNAPSGGDSAFAMVDAIAGPVLSPRFTDYEG